MAEKSTKLLLDNREMIESFFEDTRLLGIMAPIKDYQFCWQLNQVMSMDFRINDLEIQRTNKKRNYFFAVYEYAEPTGSLVHYLYNNQFDGEYLLPEFRHLDFLWLLKGDEVNDAALQQKIQAIRSINQVQLVVELKTEKIKNKENLIF
ncbi:MAG TPA: IPExxxVDY family protein [Chitinophagaceae bacterium]|nr:IPExxxVDY family protein [Chitinophagaceae bacterium]MCB9055081.1 IPExxxVDY family protein [Chitinophagales bacterium]HPG09948.1 IPExxxVDY family protein [Chitinophagaceae bacterium]HRX93107.1 IPExxxVDY family protein [Chitinophagaceae bacterium]